MPQRNGPSASIAGLFKWSLRRAERHWGRVHSTNIPFSIVILINRLWGCRTNVLSLTPLLYNLILWTLSTVALSYADYERNAWIVTNSHYEVAGGQDEPKWNSPSNFHVEVFWVLTPCSVVLGYRRFRGPCCLHLQSSPWRWRQHGSPTLHGVRTQKTSICIFTAVRTSDVIPIDMQSSRPEPISIQILQTFVPMNHSDERFIGSWVI
jgi:hypothetical protein